MTTVSVHSYTHSVTYVADNIHKSFKDIIRESGLDPTNFMDGRDSALRAMRTWIESGHLERIVLEIYDPGTDKLIRRWDLDISYEWTAGDGSFYTDTDQLRYHIQKAGIAPSQAKYCLMFKLKPGAPDVAGWGSAPFRSTEGMVKQSLGSTIQHSGLGANAGYWRNAS
jgi:hypothetical protein